LKEFTQKEKGKLGRFTQLNFNSTFTITPKKSRDKIQENKEQFSQN
jgi:hypothetical protein